MAKRIKPVMWKYCSGGETVDAGSCSLGNSMDIQTETLGFGKNSVSSWKLALEPCHLQPPHLVRDDT